MISQIPLVLVKQFPMFSFGYLLLSKVSLHSFWYKNFCSGFNNFHPYLKGSKLYAFDFGVVNFFSGFVLSV